MPDENGVLVESMVYSPETCEWASPLTQTTERVLRGDVTNIPKAVELYEGSASLEDIAEALGVSTQKVRFLLGRAGVSGL